MKTDWDTYHAQPGFFTAITRRITTRKLRRCLRLRRETVARPRVVELGGGNSCFYGALREELRPARYVIVDDNRAGLERFAQQHPNADDVELIECDVRGMTAPGEGGEADICFSVGLIEHFDEHGTREAIRAHFRAVRPGGMVVLFFPTPTWLYRAIRAAAESLGIWAFPDERPLRFGEVVGEVERHGRTVFAGVNWWIGLTQGIVVAEAARAGDGQ